ncbi:MAG TPA: phage holin family protein [Alphaproteobacteria bacterium]
MTMPQDGRPLSELLSDALNQFSALIRTEIQLARTELTGKAVKAATGLAMMAGGLVVGIAAAVLIFMAVAEWLDDVIPEGFARLLSGLIAAAIAGGLAWSGLQRMRADELAPKRTIEQLQRDAAAAKEQVKS